MAEQACLTGGARRPELGHLMVLHGRSRALAGVNRTYLSKLENGASYPGLRIIVKLTTVAEHPTRAAGCAAL